MSILPLKDFLQSLSADGIHVSTDDYRRLQKVLNSNTCWTLLKLEQVLISLFVKDRTQQESLERHFRQFYQGSEADKFSSAPFEVDKVALKSDLLQLLAIDKNKATKNKKIGSQANNLNKKNRINKIHLGLLLSGILLISWFLLPKISSFFIAEAPTQQEPTVSGASVSPAEADTKVLALEKSLKTPKETGRAALLAEAEEQVLVLEKPLQTPAGNETSALPSQAEVKALAPEKPLQIPTKIESPLPPKPAKTITPIKAITPILWLWWISVFAAFLVFLNLIYRLYQRTRIPEIPSTPKLNSEGEVYFDSATIGGEMPAWLSGNVLDDCADSIGFYFSDELSTELDVSATIKASAESAGLSEVCFLARKKQLEILILIDSQSIEQQWHPLAYELAKGLQQRGLPVTIGHLYGSLSQCRTDTGELLILSELAEERGRYVTLIFADASLPNWKTERALLEELARWPQLVWLTLREPRYWSGHEQRLQALGVSLWTADPEQMVRIFQDLAGELAERYPSNKNDRRFAKQGLQESLTNYTQRLLGDTLNLARLIAVLPPPVSPVMVVRLWRDFSPQLPITRLHRLFLLPQKHWNATGLHWGDAVLMQLRGQFQHHYAHREAEKKSLWQMLKKHYLRVEPTTKNSLAWYEWRWRMVRLWLEFEPDKALPEWEKLLKLPTLSKHLATESEQGLSHIPMPKNDDNRKRLWRLSKGKALSKHKVWPALKSDKRAALASLILTVLIIATATWQQNKSTQTAIEIAQIATDTLRAEAKSLQLKQLAENKKISEEKRLKEQALASEKIAEEKRLKERKLREDILIAKEAAQERDKEAALASVVGLIEKTKQRQLAEKPLKTNTTVFKTKTQIASSLMPVMAKIPAGSFMMGCVITRDNVEGGCNNDEKPPHKVTIKAFKLAKTEVTNQQYLEFLKEKGRSKNKNEPWFESKAEDSTSHIIETKGQFSLEKGFEQHPVINVSWYGAVAYTAWLKEKTGDNWRLPSEAQWEYAARGGQFKTAYPWGDKASHEEANYGKDECCDGLAKGKDKWVNTSPVTSFNPNKYGLYDMHGNVWEWVQDKWHFDYNKAPKDGKVWETGGDSSLRVLRGGSWRSYPQYLRSAIRYLGTPDDRIIISGFRPALGL